MDNCLTTSFNTDSELVREKMQQSKHKIPGILMLVGERLPQQQWGGGPRSFSSWQCGTTYTTPREVYSKARRLTKLAREKSSLLA